MKAIVVFLGLFFFEAHGTWHVHPAQRLLTSWASFLPTGDPPYDVNTLGTVTMTGFHVEKDLYLFNVADIVNNTVNLGLASPEKVFYEGSFDLGDKTICRGTNDPRITVCGEPKDINGNIIIRVTFNGRNIQEVSFPFWSIPGSA
uniref:Secreted protein n=1 Tax=Steinernema glaseri TaxID=37863 RepID=A0A1I7Y9G9_9BILA